MLVAVGANQMMVTMTVALRKLVVLSPNSTSWWSFPQIVQSMRHQCLIHREHLQSVLQILWKAYHECQMCKKHKMPVMPREDGTKLF